MFVAMSFRNLGRKVSGALKKVTESSSSRSSSRRLSTPTPSCTHQDEQAESQAPEEKPTQQEEEEAPDDSHLDIRGERELQPYNILKARTIRMDELHILYAMVNKIKIAPMQEMVR